MALTLFSSAAVVAAVVAGITLVRKPPPMICPPSFTNPRSADSNIKRYVFIGDIHGSSDGLKEILIGAGIIDNENGCRRLLTKQSNETVLVQLGDIVDRGKNASMVWDCLDELQETSMEGGVIRLVGNHEISWIQGNYRGSNDSPDYRRKLTSRIREAILKKRIVGALSLFDGKVLITHAGLRQQMYDFIEKNYFNSKACQDNDNELCLEKSTQKMNATNIATIIKESLLQAVEKCPLKHSLTSSSLYSPVCPELKNPMFDAGPERGGNSIGGPFWTDFSIISRITESMDVAQFVQIVGHTAADCDVDQSFKCQPIRATKHAIAADAAIYFGNRAYLELDTSSEVVTFASYTFQPQTNVWLARSLTHGRKCGKPLQRVRKSFNSIATTYQLIKKHLSRL